MEIEYLPEAKDDLGQLDKPKRIQVLRAIEKVSENPLPFTEGGLGKPLGNKHNRNLTGLLKIKVSDVRVVYTLRRQKDTVLVIVVAARADGEAYELAEKRTR